MAPKYITHDAFPGNLLGAGQAKAIGQPTGEGHWPTDDAGQAKAIVSWSAYLGGGRAVQSRQRSDAKEPGRTRKQKK